jgi:hypothetical protein
LSRRCSSLRRVDSPPRLVLAISARTTTPRFTARLQLLLEILQIESEDDDVDGFPGAADCVEQRTGACLGLRDQLHASIPAAALTS